MQFNWEGVYDTPAAPVAELPPRMPVDGTSSAWDFVDRFPPPVDGAVEAGVIDCSDEEGEGLRSIHLEHARECLATLRAIDGTRDAIHDGTNARTGRPPRNERERQNADRENADRLSRLQHSFEELLAVYDQAFGEEATQAFRLQLDAWHREGHVPAMVESSPVNEEKDEAEELMEERENAAAGGGDADPGVDADDVPFALPLPEAIERKAFGEDEQGNPVTPCEEEIRKLTEWQAKVLRELLDLKSYVDCRLADWTADQQGDERESLQRERHRLEEAYALRRVVYAEDFGEEAARRLDVWVRNNPLTGEALRAEAPPGKPNSGYPPSHPWHYYHEGDGRPPMPVESIPPAPDGSITVKLPKAGKQRQAKLMQMLADQERKLADDKARYVELVEKGVEALSVYDRTISSGGNEPLAWASAVSLKYNHVSNGLARVAWLKKQRG
jgi:hypothetical protein